MKKIILPVFAAIALAACFSNDTSDSSNVKQTEIYQHYWIDYNAETGKLESGASFRFGGQTGTSLLLNDSSSVTDNGKALVASKSFIDGTTYHLYDSTWIATHNFVYTNTDGKVFKNSYTLKTADFTDEAMTVPDGRAFSIPVEITADIGDVSVSAEDTSGVPTNERVMTTPGSKVYYDKAAHSITISPEFFTDIKADECVLRLHVNTNVSPIAEATHLGGNYSGSYTSKSLKLKRARSI